jgi:hypothetical protein
VTVIHAFSGHYARPAPALSQGPDGNLYGLISDNEGESVFRLTLAGDYTKLYLLDPATDGYFAVNGVIAASDGNIYGQVVHAFGSGDDVRSPRSGLAEGPGFVLYGTSDSGGTNGHGGLFRQDVQVGTYAVIANYGAERGSSDVTPAVDVFGHVYVSTALAYILRFDDTGDLLSSTLLPSGSRANLTVQSADGVFGVTADGGDAGGGYVFRLKWPAR